MKQRYFLFFLVSAIMLCGSSAFAQMVGDCVFLQGRYVEVGVAPNGGYGSTVDAPATYHPFLPGGQNLYDPARGSYVSSSNYLGFVADYGRDGWTVGTPPYYGDFYLPGSPQEGWTIKIGSNRYDAYIPNFQAPGTTGYSGNAGLTGTSIGYSSVGGVSRGVWKGSIGSVEIRQTTSLDTNALYFTTNVIIVNHGATATPNIYYTRTVDPDNEETRAGTAAFTTINNIVYQLPNAGNKVLVSAVGNTSGYSPNAYLGLGTKDCRAKCMIFDAGTGLAPSAGGDSMWNQQTSFIYNVGGSSTADVGIGLDFNIGSIAAGDSTTLTYCYILNALYIDSALNATLPNFFVNNSSFPSGSTINLCTYAYDTAYVSMGAGGFYHWRWSPDSLLTSDSAISNNINITGITTPLTYTVTGINVAGGCDTIHYTLTLKRDTFSIALGNPDTTICLGDSGGTRVSGPPLLHYQWTPATGVSNDTIMSPMITPSVTTTYTVTASSTSGCPAVSKYFTITVNHPVLDSITFTNPTVCGYNDGTITLYGLQTGFLDTVHYDSATTPHAPLPVGVSSSLTITLTGIYAGVYDNFWVKVGLCPTNIKGPATLVNPAPPVVTVDSPLVKTCVGIPVLLHSYATPTGITYNYSWSPPTYLSAANIANPVVNPAVSGDIIYTVTVNPGGNPACAGTATVRVHTLDPFTLNNNDTVICIGNHVQASITGSNEFSYLWSPATGVSNTSLKNPTITPVVSNTYLVTASYAHCPDMVQGFHIEVDTPATPITIIDTICLGMTDYFDLTVPGSVAGGNYYHYQWQLPSSVDLNNDTIPNPIFTPTTLGPHNYSVIIHPSALGCSITDFVNIWVLPSTITIQPTDTMVCKGKSVQVIGFGGNPVFTYQWIPTAGIAVSNVFNAFITPDTSALYTVTASFHRCPDIHATLNLSVQPTPTVYIGGNRLFCQFDTIHIRASVEPAWYGGYTYAWTPPADLDNTTSASVVFSGNANTILYVNVTTPAGCTSNDSARITVFPGNFASLTPDRNSFCPHTSTTLTPTGSAGVTYHWYPSVYLSDSMGSAPVITPVTSQVYTCIATSANGCKDTFNYSALVYPSAVMLMEDSVTLYPGESYHIQPSTNCTSFLWFPPAGLSEVHMSDPVATPQISTKYTVHGYTENGCDVYDSINVIVSDESLLAMPNAFTPGTGVNNTFKIILKGQATLNYYRVFNRWGNMVFETTNISDGWDGSYKGQQQPLGVYVYEVQAVGSNGHTFTKRGNVTLLR